MPTGAYLDSLPVGELAELLGDLPRSRQEPLGLGVLMIALIERLSDAFKLLPPAGHPGPGEGRRRSLREVVADRRAARASRHAGTPASGLAEWFADRQQQADLHAERARAGAVGERWVAEALRARASDPDPAAGARSLATHQPNRSAIGRTRSATASPSTTGCRWAAPTTGSTTSCRTGRAAGAARNHDRRTAEPG